jgi:hypothetical protein
VAVYPFSPTPSSIQAPSIKDPMHIFETDSGVTLRRSKHSRGVRRYQLDYLGKTTAEWRIVRDFLQQQRLGALPFEYVNVNAIDLANFSSTTPIYLTMQHAYLTGQWVTIFSTTPAVAITGPWQITRFSSAQFSLNGSTAAGSGTCYVGPYLPNAIGIFGEDEAPSPTKLMGPESITTTRGKFSWSVIVEELL